MKKILLLPHIKIQNANALSSPYTIGFPAMTAWLGGVHALQRKLNVGGYKTLRLNSVAVICHNVNLQTYQGNGDYIYSFSAMGHPLKKDGNRPTFIEEARCHLIVSLAIEYEGLGLIDKDEFIDSVTEILHSKLKFAGGDILGLKSPELLYEEGFQIMKRKLMPGYTIIERRDLMKKAMAGTEKGGEGQDAINAILDYLKMIHTCDKDPQGNVQWQAKRKTRGWIVPIATGFHGITELGVASNQRDPTTQHRFAESSVTLGEFVMPYRIKDLDDMLWHYHADIENNLYLCQQNNQIK